MCVALNFFRYNGSTVFALVESQESPNMPVPPGSNTQITRIMFPADCINLSSPTELQKVNTFFKKVPLKFETLSKFFLFLENHAPRSTTELIEKLHLFFIIRASNVIYVSFVHC